MLSKNILNRLNWHDWHRLLIVTLTGAIAVSLLGCEQSFELVTAAEYSEIADLPDTDEILRGPPVPDAPKITVRKPDGATVKTPFDIEISFEPSADATIMPDTARVVYVKGLFRKDLTELIRQNAKMDENGIHGKKAAIPTGKHRFLVEVSDNAGRIGETEFRIRVVD